MDLFVIGKGIDEIELARRTSEAGALLGREITVVIYTSQEIRTMVQAEHPYVGRVLQGPKIWIRGEDDENLLAA